MSVLDARLDHSLPTRIHAAGGTAILLRGSFDAAGTRDRDISVVIDGVERQPTVIAGAGARRRFWALVEVPADAAPLDLSILLRHRPSAAAESWDPLADLHLSAERQPLPAVEPPIAPPDPPGRGPHVAICLATYEPKLELLRRLVASLRAQLHRDWIAIVSDDGSSRATRAAIGELTAADERFHVVWNTERRGVYGNFERALAAVPGWVDQVALCDQDDVWHPHKLSRLVEVLAPADRSLACSDARVVDASGRVLADTIWTTRRRGAADLPSLLAANWVCGATAAFDRRLLDVALPFPVGPDIVFHDNWIACVAAASGGVHALDEPLIDYVQHGDNAFGHARTVAPEITRLRLRETWRAMAPAGARAPRSSLSGHIDALMRVALIETTLRLRLGRHALGSTPALSCGTPDAWRRLAVRQAARALLARARGGPAGAEAGVAWGALAAAATARRAAPADGAGAGAGAGDR